MRLWLEKLEAAATLLQAKQLADDDPAAAEAKIRGILAEAPDNAAASLALAELLLAQDRDDECGQLIEKLEARGFLEPEAEHIKAELALKSRSSLDIDGCGRQRRRVQMTSSCSSRWPKPWSDKNNTPKRLTFVCSWLSATDRKRANRPAP